MNIIRDKHGKFRSIKDLRPFEQGKEFIVSTWEIGICVVGGMLLGMLIGHVINLLVSVIWR